MGEGLLIDELTERNESAADGGRPGASGEGHHGHGAAVKGDGEAIGIQPVRGAGGDSRETGLSRISAAGVMVHLANLFACFAHAGARIAQV